MIPVDDDIELTGEQRQARDLIMDWYGSAGGPQVFYLAGYAGTGKTSLAKHLVAGLGGRAVGHDDLKELRDGWLPGRLIVFAAYTGKAARVMRHKGLVGASTIHSLCYIPVNQDEERIELLQKRIEQLPSGSDERILLMQELEELCAVKFQRNTHGLAAYASLIVIDECSMVNEEMALDLLAFGVPILVLGDPGQLPPIDGAGYFTARKPDFMLEEIHRQKAGDPIIQVATMVRKGERVPFGQFGRTVAKRPRLDLVNGRPGLAAHMDRYNGLEQVLVGKNKTRRHLNKLIRMARKNETQPPLPVWLPNERDKVIIRRNSKALGLMNGDFVTLHEVRWTGSPVITAIIWPEGWDEPIARRQSIYGGRFQDTYDLKDNREVLEFQYVRRSIMADFGYVLTTHVAQGSQWRSILVMDERMKGTQEDYNKWLYTAVTRAESVLMILS